jgi:hypothetical protein
VSLEHIVDGMKMVEKGDALKVLISPWLDTINPHSASEISCAHRKDILPSTS